MRSRGSGWAALGLALALGCQNGLAGWNRSRSGSAEIEGDVYRRAENERAEYYAREVERLRADLRQAEESIVAMESGLRGSQSRADAVSALAEARIALERVSPSVPWRSDRIAEARSKLDEAARQLDEGHVGSAVFFASRAQRITSALRAEVKQVSAWENKRYIASERANLRTGPSTEYRIVGVLVEETPVFPERRRGDWTLVRTPSGELGWVYSALLRRP